MQRSKKRVNRKPKGRQARIYKQPNSTIFNVNVEASPLVKINTGTNNIVFTSTGLKYVDVAVLFGVSTTFTEMSARFSMYRINSLKIEFRSLFSPPTNSVNEHQFVAVGFFPSTTSSAIGDAQVMYYDKSLTASTMQTLMSRKQTFYNNYFEGTGAGGYGTWNSVNTVSQLTGSIQLGQQNGSTSASANTNIAILRIIFNVTFKEKQLTA